MKPEKLLKILPRTEFLLHHTKAIEYALIAWYKEKFYSQGDNYQVHFDSCGRWIVNYSNDYPLQHGEGKSYTISPDDFKEATKGLKWGDNLYFELKNKSEPQEEAK